MYVCEWILNWDFSKSFYIIYSSATIFFTESKRLSYEAVSYVRHGMCTKFLPECFHCWNLQYKKHRHTHAAQVKASVDSIALIHTSLITISSYINRPWTFTGRCVPFRWLLRLNTVVVAAVTVVDVAAAIVRAATVVVVTNSEGSMRGDVLRWYA